MKRTVLSAAFVFALGIVAVRWLSQTKQVEAQGLPDATAVSVRIVFGEKQESTRDYSGSVSVSQGRVLAIKPWRFFGSDAVDGISGWKLQLKYAVFESQPDRPRPLSTPGPPQNIVPAGVTVTLQAPPTAVVRVATAQGSFEVPLRDLFAGTVRWFMDGDVWVQQTPASRMVSPAGIEENDHPSIAVTRAGVVWTAWQAYKDNGDHVYARHSTASGWSDPFQLTTAKGDVFQTAIGEDTQGRIWAVWSERKGQDWDLYARFYSNNSWSAVRRLTAARQPNAFHKLIGGSHLIWTGYDNGRSHVYWSKLTGDTWSEPREVSGASAWMPDAALDSKGNLWVVWDSYRPGNYDIFARRVGADGTLGEEQQVTRSPRFQAHASVAIDKQDRVWVAWDESGSNWGKDYSRDDTWRSTTMYADRFPKVAVLDGGVWKQPAADVMAAVPQRYSRYIQVPKLAADANGRIWLSLQIRTACGNNRSDFWANNGKWERFLTSFEGDRWSPLMPLPESGSRNEAPFQMQAAGGGVWMTWANDNRPLVAALAAGGGAGKKGAKKGAAKKAVEAAVNPQRTPIYEIDAATFSRHDAPRSAQFSAFQETTGNAASLHLDEPADVARMRSYRTNVGGASMRIVRGDFHRHTEISTDGAGDGSVEDYFRYMMDAAEMDTGIISDHNAGNDNEYTWWRTEKAHDLYFIRNRFTPLFGYERSVPYPNGHRNVVFAQRGVRTLPITRDEQQGMANTGPILYPYLKQHRGIAMLHSLATDQGSDYGDNDPEVEPLVELYQGYHANYEYEGAPRAETPAYVVSAHGKLQPAGFYWNALAKGYLLGVQSSSDHISTHSSYTMIYTPGTGREEIVESMRKRHAYGATDNIILDYSATDAANRTHFMGDAFASRTAPRLNVKVTGTGKIATIEIIKDGKFVFLTRPEGATAQFTFVDQTPGSAKSWYYVRVMQVDRNMAWSSPIWVDYR
jgi:hypothetical protein